MRDQGIPNGDPKLTLNGRRLINLTNKLNLKFINKSPKCKNKWTRINTKNENEKSKTMHYAPRHYIQT